MEGGEAFGQIRRRWAGRCRIRPSERCGPVPSKIDRHEPQIGGWHRAQPRKRRGLEFDDLRLVDLENLRAVGPVQAVAAGVEAGCQDHALTDACRAASWKNSSKYRVRAAIMSVIRSRPQPASRSSTAARSNSPLAHRVKKSTPTARTSGSAEWIVDQGIVDVGCDCPCSGDHGRGSPHAGCEIPQPSSSVRATSSPFISTSCLACVTRWRRRYTRIP